MSFSQRRRLKIALCALAFGTAGLTTVGCASFLNRGGEKDEESEKALERLLTIPEPPDFIREAIVPKGMNVVRVDGVALVNGLMGTGGPPEPSVLRDQLIGEMRRHEVENPNHVLEAADTALVEVRALILPGAQKGDPVDLVIAAPPGGNVTDLHNGWLMETRLRHQQMIQNSIKSSDVMLVGRGPILTKADHQPGTDQTLRTKGYVLGGGRVLQSREIGLVLRPKYQHVKMAAAISQAINRRFFFFDGTTRRGISEPLEDDYIRLDVHPRYQSNPARLIEVIRAMSVKPESGETQQRLVDLRQRMGNPGTAAEAALQLESLGESAVPTLVDVLTSEDPEIRFYAAEALAYLDRSEAIEPLEIAARETPAFRHPALLALEGLQDTGAVMALLRLTHQPSLETRYGAFSALRRRRDATQSLSSEDMGHKYRLFRVPSDAEPTIAISLRETPEIVMFGTMPGLDFRSHLFGPGGLMIKPDADDPSRLRVNRFLPGEETRVATVQPTVEGLCRGIVEVGGGYGDTIAVLREAKEKNFLYAQLATDPLPQNLRTYHRDGDEGKAADEGSASR